MATNEDLAVAFLCLCGQTEKNEILRLVDNLEKIWDDKENIARIRAALELPTHMIARKIANLHTGLYCCPQKKKIYEEMANLLANSTANFASPIVKARSGPISEVQDHILNLNLNLNT